MREEWEGIMEEHIYKLKTRYASSSHPSLTVIVHLFFALSSYPHATGISLKNVFCSTRLLCWKAA
jgi:hypothetical protein